MEMVRFHWGKPHLHGGVGIRRLAAQLYESRVGLEERLIFQNLETGLHFHFLGSHDEVQKFLRSHVGELGRDCWGRFRETRSRR